VRELAADANDRAIVRTIINGEELDINVIAEGIETVEQTQ
jgi:EAL domain-containing protein (putative c-di-GMP-specific phosphodiesterase class I)